MSRNLATSSCCDRVVRLSDLRGKPIEFRRYGPYAPSIGCRYDCPVCGTAYFAIWRSSDRYWSDPERAMEPVHHWGSQEIENTQVGRFVFESSDGRLEQTGTFTIDLSFYESYNDEHDFDEDTMAEKLGMTPDRGIGSHGIPVFRNYHEIHDAWERTFPGEPKPVSDLDNPAYLCLDDAEETQWIW